MFTVPVGGCSRVEDVFFSGQQRQAVRVQVNRSHHDAAVFLCTPQTSALQHTFCVTSKQAVPLSKVAFSEFCRRCVTSEGEGLLELEVARQTLLLCISPAGKLHEEESLQKLHLLLWGGKTPLLLHNFSLSRLLQIWITDRGMYSHIKTIGR